MTSYQWINIKSISIQLSAAVYKWASTDSEYINRLCDLSIFSNTLSLIATSLIMSLTKISHYEEKASKILSDPVWAYFQKSAGDGITLQSNRSSYDRWDLYYYFHWNSCLVVHNEWKEKRFSLKRKRRKGTAPSINILGANNAQFHIFLFYWHVFRKCFRIIRIQTQKKVTFLSIEFIVSNDMLAHLNLTITYKWFHFLEGFELSHVFWLIYRQDPRNAKFWISI